MKAGCVGGSGEGRKRVSECLLDVWLSCDGYVQQKKERRLVLVEFHPCVSLCRRVHISEATRSKLVGEFELEETNGAERDSLLKECGVKTYLVVDRGTNRVSCWLGE